MPSQSSGVATVRRFLDGRGIHYAVTEHDEAYTAASEARAAGAEPPAAAKVVMLHDDDGYVMAVVQASERLDLAKARHVAGRPGLRIAEEQDLGRDFPDWPVGALPPLGPLVGAAEVVDSRLLHRSRVVCNGGDHAHSIVLATSDLVDVCDPQVADIAADRREGAAATRVPRPGPVLATMQAYRLTGWQQPAELCEVPIPEPGPGEVLLKVGGAGACHSDLHLMDWPAGTLPFDPPFTLGHENAGWVERVGAGVDAVRPGEPVAVYGPWGCGRCRACRASRENSCERAAEIGVMGGGLGRDGGMAEYLLVPSARLLVPLGDLDPRDAAPLGDAALTPYHAIRRSLHKLLPGSSAMVIGVGGLGHVAVQLLRALCSTRIVAVDLSPEKLALAREVGADVAIAPGPDAVEEVREATHGRMCDVVIDIVGSDDTLALGVACGRAEGDLALVGLAGGAHQMSFFSQPYECGLATTYWGSAIELMEVLDLARDGRIDVHVERHPLDAVADVYARLRDGGIAGRAVICPSG